MDSNKTNKILQFPGSKSRKVRNLKVVRQNFNSPKTALRGRILLTLFGAYVFTIGFNFVYNVSTSKVSERNLANIPNGFKISHEKLKGIVASSGENVHISQQPTQQDRIVFADLKGQYQVQLDKESQGRLRGIYIKAGGNPIVVQSPDRFVKEKLSWFVGRDFSKTISVKRLVSSRNIQGSAQGQVYRYTIKNRQLSKLLVVRLDSKGFLISLELK